AMQDCFRQHPDIYGAELDDDEAGAEPAAEQTPVTQADASASSDEKHQHAKEVHDQVKSTTDEVAESEGIVPKAWHESEPEKKPEQQTEE
ncbi:hypothetical protein BDW62DRAFT_202692, partial [Aspergillus aurantiobrunneus]